MKKALLILFVFVFSLLYYAGGLTKKETLPLSKEFFLRETSSSIHWAWEVKKPGLVDRKELGQLYELKLDRGIRNIPILAFFLIRGAEQARRKGDFDEALERANDAVKFSPDLPQPYFELARVRWHQNPLQLQKILREIFRGVRAYVGHYPSFVRFYYNVFYLFSNAILMTFVLFGMLILVKYFPLYFHEIRKNSNQDISRVLIAGVKIFCLLIPFFLRMDMLWAILFWSILLWGYATKREKQWILLFLIALVYLPFFLRSASSFLDGPASEVVSEMSRANYEDLDKGGEEKLHAWLSAHPEDPEVLFTLGLTEKRQGRYVEAEEFYQRAIRKNPKFSEAFSNLGSVYLAQRQTDSAIASYLRAIDLDSGKAAYYYNLYRAYAQQTFLSGKAGQAFQRARQLSPDLVDYYSSIDNLKGPPNINRLVIDEVLAPRTLSEKALTHIIGREGLLFHLFKAWFEKIRSRVPFLAPILFFAFLIGMSRYARTKRFLTRCPMCGTPTYRLYLGDSDREFVCFNCSRIFVQKEKLHPQIARKKFLEIQEFQKEDHFIGRFLSVFFVGFAYLWREDFSKGLILLFLFFIFILKFVYWGGVIPSYAPQQPVTFSGMISWGGLFIFFYVFFIRQIFSLKPRGKGRQE